MKFSEAYSAVMGKSGSDEAARKSIVRWWAEAANHKMLPEKSWNELKTHFFLPSEIEILKAVAQRRQARQDQYTPEKQVQYVDESVAIENAKLLEENARLKAENETYRADPIKAQKEVNEIKAEIKTLREEKGILKTVIELFESAKRLKKQAEELLEKIRNMNSTITKLKGDIAALEKYKQKLLDDNNWILQEQQIDRSKGLNYLLSHDAIERKVIYQRPQVQADPISDLAGVEIYV